MMEGMTPLPYGQGLSFILAEVMRRRPTAAEAEEAARMCIDRYGDGGHALSKYPDDDIDSLLADVMRACDIKLDDLVAAGLSRTSVSRWRGSLTQITTQSFIELCKGVAKAADSNASAWNALGQLTINQTETDEYLIRRIEERQRAEISEAVQKLGGAALDSVYIHAKALAEAVPDGWSKGVRNTEELTETQRALLVIDTSAAISANNTLNEATRNQMQ